MPSRIVREGINSSARINLLSPLAELFYRRLILVADDFGRFHGSPATLRAACWPTCPDRVSEKDVSKWLSDCAQPDSKGRALIIQYEVDGAKYIEICDFRQQTRTKSKFPEPVINLISDCKQTVRTSRSRISEANAEANAKTDEHTPVAAAPLEAEDIAAIADEPIAPKPELVQASPFQAAVSEISKSIHQRHPEFRRSPLEVVDKRLRYAVKDIQSVEEKIKRMREIDARHARWCASDEWAGRQMVSNLGNWFTRGICMNEPPPDQLNFGHQRIDFTTEMSNRIVKNLEETGKPW